MQKRRKKSSASVLSKPAAERIENFRQEILESGEEAVPPLEEFEEWVRRKSERELWFFSRWILGNDYLSLGTFHRKELCPFFTDYSISRSKLALVPMGHLKTTVSSRSIPLHVLIQPAQGNIYFPGKLGRNCRILIAQESEQKSKDNLSVSKENLEGNPLIHWLWPQVCWANVKEAPRWKDNEIEVPRTRVWAEPSIRAVGIKTGFVGSYYDMIIADDIAALEASQNPPLMERAKKWRRASRTRFYDKLMGIYIGVGTHWPSNEDVYTVWEKDKGVETMVRAVEELDESGNLVPLWPEKFTPEIIEQIRKDTNAQDWACWYMNQPVSGGYTSLSWGDLREYQMLFDSSTNRELLVFAESKLDEIIDHRQQRVMENLGFRLPGKVVHPQGAMLRKKPPNGMDEQHFQHFAWKYGDKEEDAAKAEERWFGKN